MRKAVTITAVATVIVVLSAYVAYSFFAPPELAQHRKPGEIKRPDLTAAVSGESPAPRPPEVIFKSAARIKFGDEVFAFNYPNTWEIGEPQNNEVDATVRVMRPGSQPIRAGINLVVTRSPTVIQAPKPILPPGSKIVRQEITHGAKMKHFVEFTTVTAHGDYERGTMVAINNTKRYVRLIASCDGPATQTAEIDQQFEELRGMFDEVLLLFNVQADKP